jgi:hypothetical protein
VEHKALQATGSQRSSWSNLGRSLRGTEYTDPRERPRSPEVVKRIALRVVEIAIAWPLVTLAYLSFDKFLAMRER